MSLDLDAIKARCEAARAAHDQQARLHGLTPWDETGACDREPWLHQQRAALEAALGGER